MLKRKLLMTVLPLVSALTVVGTGFAIWEFGEGREETTVEISVGATAAFDYYINNVTIDAPDKLLLDQNFNFFVKNGVEDGDLKMTFDVGDISAVDITLRPYFGGIGVANYLSVNTDGVVNGVKIADNVYTFEDVKVTSNKTNTFIFGLNGVEEGESTGDVVFKWIDGNKPTNMTLYNAMVEAIAKGNVAFDITITKAA